MEVPKLTTKAHIGELADVGNTLINIVTASNIEGDATLEAISKELKTATNEMIFAVEKDQAVSKLEAFDQVRDNAVQDLFHYLQGLCRVGTEEEKNNSKTIFNQVKKYGLGVVNLSYAEESTNINSLLLDLSKDEHLKIIAELLHVPGLVESLQTAQQNFEEYYETYLEELAKNRRQQSATNLKPILINIINRRLVKYLRSQAEFNPHIYSPLAEKASIAIERINSNVRERKNTIATKKS